uniref:Uncharacterized protein n=1 Tax=Anguilla anguilla TaxID=7936 RepID=A0A0E9VA35_ANGAN
MRWNEMGYIFWYRKTRKVP